MLRFALLDFIADFANWDNSTVPAYLETSRALTQSAHEALGGEPGTRPLVVDPFAGGGSIPLEALRVGADAFASDLNPVAVLLNKVVLELIPRFGRRLAEAVVKYGREIQADAEQLLNEFYPPSSDGSQPLAYLWARTIISEAPEGNSLPIEVPMCRSMWLSKNSEADLALRWVRDPAGVVETDICDVVDANDNVRRVRRPRLEMFGPSKANEVEDGTVARGAVTCPVTGYTTPITSVRKQLKLRRGGASDARLMAIRETNPSLDDRTYRKPTDTDLRAVGMAARRLKERSADGHRTPDGVPTEPTPMGGGRGAGRAFSQRNYGMNEFRDLFTPRQLLALSTLQGLIKSASSQIATEYDADFAIAVQTCLALALSRLTDFCSSLCVLKAAGNRGVVHTFGRQAIPIVWDFAETNPLNQTSASWLSMMDYLEKAFQPLLDISGVGQAHTASATEAPASR